MIMDELGYLESSSELFCRAVLERLGGRDPVIAAVKDRDTAFLSSVRSHPGCRCFFITEENRDALYEEVLDFVKNSSRQLFGHGEAWTGKNIENMLL